MAEDRRRRLRRHVETRIPATHAAKTFGRLVNRVQETRATYVIERGGKPVAQIGPVPPTMTVGEFVAWLRRPNRPRAGEEYLRAVEEAVRRHNTPRRRRNPWER
jgi:hypothetical protein